MVWFNQAFSIRMLWQSVQQFLFATKERCKILFVFRFFILFAKCCRLLWVPMRRRRCGFQYKRHKLLHTCSRFARHFRRMRWISCMDVFRYQKLLEYLLRISTMIRKNFLLRAGFPSRDLAAFIRYLSNLKWLDDFMTDSFFFVPSCRSIVSVNERERSRRKTGKKNQTASLFLWSISTRNSHLMADLCAVDAMCMLSVCDAFS